MKRWKTTYEPPVQTGRKYAATRTAEEHELTENLFNISRRSLGNHFFSQKSEKNVGLIVTLFSSPGGPPGLNRCSVERHLWGGTPDGGRLDASRKRVTQYNSGLEGCK